MARWKPILTLLMAHLALATSLDMVCYFTNWAQYRHDPYKYTVGNIDYSACTHIIFAFAKLVGAGHTNMRPYEPNDYDQYKNLNDLKKSGLKTLLAVGGYTHGSAPFSDMASSAQNRAQFIDNAVSYLKQHRFDGLDIDWEYPSKNDKDNLSSLLKEFRERIENERANGYNLLLTMAVSAGVKKSKDAYDVPVLDRYLDFINLMAYDYHGPWETKTGLSTPLDSPDWDDMSVTKSVNWYLCNGMSRNKIQLGLALYGHTWTLSQAGEPRLNASAPSKGSMGRYTRSAGFLSLYEICTQRNRYQEKLDPLGQVYYATKGNQFITYETAETFQTKLQFLKQHQLRGAMVWALDLDDYHSICGPSSFLRGISETVMNVDYTNEPAPPAPVCKTAGHTNPPIQTQPPYVWTPQQTYRPIQTQPPYVWTPQQTYRPIQTQLPYKPPKTQSPPVWPQQTPDLYYDGDKNSCKQSNGVTKFGDTHSCEHYYQCIGEVALWVPCPPPMNFDPHKRQCVLPHLYQCPS